jgi:hypothetical protein
MKNPIFIGKEGKTEIKYIQEKIVKIGKNGVVETTYKSTGKLKPGNQGGDKLICRILRPSEFMLMYDTIAKGNKDDLTNFQMCLLLGARYNECKRIQLDKKMWDGNVHIEIKETKIKRKEKHSERWIKLSNKGKTIIPYFFDVNRYLPSVQTWDEKLQRWAQLAGITDEKHLGITSRMLRKTWESWLIFYYPNYILHILDSQGHTLTTSAKHYTRLPFDEEDRKLMTEWVQGWQLI